MIIKDKNITMQVPALRGSCTTWVYGKGKKPEAGKTQVMGVKCWSVAFVETSVHHNYQCPRTCSKHRLRTVVGWATIYAEIQVLEGRQSNQGKASFQKRTPGNGFGLSRELRGRDADPGVEKSDKLGMIVFIYVFMHSFII